MCFFLDGCLVAESETQVCANGGSLASASLNCVHKQDVYSWVQDSTKKEQNFALRHAPKLDRVAIGTDQCREMARNWVDDIANDT